MLRDQHPPLTTCTNQMTLLWRVMICCLILCLISCLNTPLRTPPRTVAIDHFVPKLSPTLRFRKILDEKSPWWKICKLFMIYTATQRIETDATPVVMVSCVYVWVQQGHWVKAMTTCMTLWKFNRKNLPRGHSYHLHH